MEEYQHILKTEIYAMAFLIILCVLFCIAAIIIIIKCELDKYMYLLVIVGLVLLAISMNRAFDCMKDMNESLYVEYVGTYSYRGRDTVRLDDDKHTKLNAGYCNPTDDGKPRIIIYAKNTKIIVDSKDCE
ncbi:MAG: hypothetical protein IJ036_02110 [Lachnospiraceae bacterium]|nr:hypothetical protein [Lachnospiraceae bacterium]